MLFLLAAWIATSQSAFLDLDDLAQQLSIFNPVDAVVDAVQWIDKSPQRNITSECTFWTPKATCYSQVQFDKTEDVCQAESACIGVDRDPFKHCQPDALTDQDVDEIQDAITGLLTDPKKRGWLKHNESGNWQAH